MLLLVPAPTVRAEDRALLLLRNLQQRLEFSYIYDYRRFERDEGASSSSTRNRFEETYRLDIDYAVYDPDLWNGHITLEGALDQERFSHSSNNGGDDGFNGGQNLRHAVNGRLFQTRPISLNFFSTQDTSHITREYTDNYYQYVRNHGATLIGSNDYLPFHFDYSYSEVESDGLPRDFLRTTEIYTLGLAHRVENFSRTNLNINAATTRFHLQGDPQTDRLESADVSLRNALSWLSGNNSRILTTSVRQGSEEGKVQGSVRERDFFEWMESLQWQFGRALHSGVSYNWLDHDATTYSRQSSRGKAFLRHQFVESLTTQIDLEASEDTLLAGEEKETSGSLHLTYVKRLPERGNLLLQYSTRYGLVDREFDSSIFFTETHPLPSSGQIVLLNPGILALSIEVREADPLVRLTPYLEGEDYLVDQVGQITVLTILPGRIPSDSTLVIDYRFVAEADAEYREKANRVAGSLGLRDNQYRLYGSWEQTDQKLVSGTSDALYLNDTRLITLGAEVLRPAVSYGLEYKDFDLGFDQYRSIYGFLRYSRYLPRGVLTLGATNTYTMVEAIETSDGKIPSRNQNTFNLNTSFRGQLFGRGRFQANLNYLNSRGDFIDRDDVSLGADYQMNYGKFSLLLKTRMIWRLTGDDTTREDYLSLDLIRYL